MIEIIKNNNFISIGSECDNINKFIEHNNGKYINDYTYTYQYIDYIIYNNSKYINNVSEYANLLNYDGFNFNKLKKHNNLKLINFNCFKKKCFIDIYGINFYNLLKNEFNKYIILMRLKNINLEFINIYLDNTFQIVIIYNGLKCRFKLYKNINETIKNINKFFMV